MSNIFSALRRCSFVEKHGNVFGWVENAVRLIGQAAKSLSTAPYFPLLQDIQFTNTERMEVIQNPLIDGIFMSSGSAPCTLDKKYVEPISIEMRRCELLESLGHQSDAILKEREIRELKVFRFQTDSLIPNHPLWRAKKGTHKEVVEMNDEDIIYMRDEYFKTARSLRDRVIFRVTAVPR